MIDGHVINHEIINDPFKNGEFIQESFIIYVLGQAGDKITLVMGSKRILYSWSTGLVSASEKLSSIIRLVDAKFIIISYMSHVFYETATVVIIFA